MHFVVQACGALRSGGASPRHASVHSETSGTCHEWLARDFTWGGSSYTNSTVYDNDVTSCLNAAINVEFAGWIVNFYSNQTGCGDDVSGCF